MFHSVEKREIYSHLKKIREITVDCNSVDFTKVLLKSSPSEFPHFSCCSFLILRPLFRYNVDCAAAEGLYGLAEGAFGSDAGAGGEGGAGGGECPAASPLSDAECAGAVSNCWSPGQPDTDCPNYGLCCFDGCANTCVDGPTESKYY